jgi:DNA-binding ferritin-like protein (Dps family)
MSFWDTITGNDMTRDWKAFTSRAQLLPAGHQDAWTQIQDQLHPYAGFTGRNLTPILDAALTLLEEAAADGQTATDVLGDDIPGFCQALAGGEGARSYRDRWREQLNSNVARKLGRLGG